VDLVRERLGKQDVDAGYILDGFPRTVPQADALAEMEDPDIVINFVVSDEILIERLSGRRVCTSCGYSHHVKFLPPRAEGVCDRCGGKLVQREDDTEKSIRKRLAVYQTQTAPLIDYYRRKNQIKDVDGAPAPDMVFDSVTAVLPE
jgi:adenylate kinase